MLSMRKIRFVFALQYIAAEGGSKITYRSTLDEKHRSQGAIKRKHRKIVCDKYTSFGPPEKHQYFNGNSLLSRKKRKMWKIGSGSTYSMPIEFGTGNGCLPTYNFKTGKWIVKFYDDNETEVTFPDKEIRIVN